MDDLIQILVYVAFLLIYLVSKLLKNKKGKPVTRLPEQETQRDFSDWETPERRPEVGQGQGRSGMDEPERKPSTLEEILRELTGAETWEEQERRQKEENRRAMERQQEKARQEAAKIEQKVTQKAEDYSGRLGDAVQQAKRARNEQGRGLKEIERLVEPIKPKRKYQWRGRRSVGQDIARSLRNPQSAKRAIILSEILNRKYF